MQPPSRFQKSTSRRTYAPTDRAERLYPKRHERLPLPDPTVIPPGPYRVIVLAARVLSGKQLFHPLDRRDAPVGVLGAAGELSRSCSRTPLRLVAEYGGDEDLAEIEEQAERARRVVERAEFADAIARLNRLLDKFWRQAEGIGLRPGRLRGSVAGWLERESRRVLAE